MSPHKPIFICNYNCVVLRKSHAHQPGKIIDGLAQIIKEVAVIDPSDVTMEKSFMHDLDLDSLSLVQIAVKREDKFGLKIPDEDLAGLYTVADTVAYIQKFMEENPEAAADLLKRFG